jgi:hypothetical protein
MTLIVRAILSCEVGRHGRHDDSILQFQISELKRTENGSPSGHRDISRTIPRKKWKIFKENGIQYCIKLRTILDEDGPDVKR